MHNAAEVGGTGVHSRVQVVDEHAPERLQGWDAAAPDQGSI
jgi:hypothetical protein